jgi:hypothetical protein
MKQRITVEQLDELSLNQQNNLYKWWAPKARIGDESISVFEDGKYVREFGPLLTIGQCIELLQEKAPRLLIGYTDEWDVGFCTDEVPYLECANPFNQDALDKHYQELIDALWDALKVVL